MTTALHTPQATAKGAVVNLSGRKVWRKQILPLGLINYDGRQIKFDSDYHKELVQNFRAGAYSQVPFQLADADNRHTNDPERTRGQLVDLRAEPSGLYGYFELTDPTVVLNNQNLGVSCRILENYTRESDDKTFGRVLQHVLGTLDPRISGMKPWESVELSNETAQLVLDLSNRFYTEDGGSMPDDNKSEKHVVELSTAQLEKLEQLLAGGEAGNDGKPDAELDEAELIQLFGDGDEETADGDDSEEEETDGESGDETEFPQGKAGDGSVGLAAVHNLQNQVLELTNRLERKDNEHELAQLAATGLAPAIIEAARPLLAIQSGVVELSNGQTVSPARQVRELLRTVLELSNKGLDVVSFDREQGSLVGDDSADKLRQSQVDEMERLYGS